MSPRNVMNTREVTAVATAGEVARPISTILVEMEHLLFSTRYVGCFNDLLLYAELSLSGYSTGT